MLKSEMETALKSLDRRVENLDHRVGRIEQILPTLATKIDLERFATKDDLRHEIRGVKVLIEDARGDTRLLAEHVSWLMTQVATLTTQMTEVLRRLERFDPH